MIHSLSSFPASWRSVGLASLAFITPLAATALYLYVKEHFAYSAPPKYVVEEHSSKGALITPENMKTQSLSTIGLEQPLVVAMVGLPARGKSYIVKMIVRYLTWIGFEVKVFNVGSYRRTIGHAGVDSSFFSFDNAAAKKMREEMALAVQEEMYQWIHESEKKCRVAIFDATNTTRARRELLCDRAHAEHTSLLFVESICDDEEILARNYALKLENDDYKGKDKVQAMADFMNRVHAYEKVYETIADNEDEGNISYIKLINVGQKVITRNCTEYLASQVAFYLQNAHIEPRRIFLSLPAESAQELVGGDSSEITEQGRQYSLDFAKYLKLEHEHDALLQCEAREKCNGNQRKKRDNTYIALYGTAKIHTETVAHLRMKFKCCATPLLNELRGGSFQGLSMETIQQQYPEEYKKRMSNKLRYRYPGVGGESYLDVIERIRPVIIELERQRHSVILVCHLAVLRCIYAYFTGTEVEKIPFIPIEPHRIYELTPGAFGCTAREINPAEELAHM